MKKVTRDRYKKDTHISTNQSTEEPVPSVQIVACTTESREADKDRKYNKRLGNDTKKPHVTCNVRKK